MNLKSKSKPEYKYGLFNFQKHEWVGQYQRNDFAMAHKIVAQHYKYVKSTRKALIKVFKISGGRKAHFFIWLLKHCPRNNEFLYSQRELAKVSHVSRPTVERVLKELKSCHLVVIKVGGIIVSPELFFYGNSENFLYSMKKYKSYFKKPNNEKKYNKALIKKLEKRRIERRIKRRKQLQLNDESELKKIKQEEA